MRIELIYWSFDEKQFDTEEECVAYEAECQDFIDEILRKLVFLDTTYLPIVKNSDDYENFMDVLSNIEWAYQTCEYIYVKEMLTSNCAEWAQNYFGWYLPEGEGMWEADFNSYCEWHKIEE